MHHCGAGARRAQRSEERRERCGEAGGAQAAVAGREVGWGGGFECAVLMSKDGVQQCILVEAMGKSGEWRRGKGATNPADHSTTPPTTPHQIPRASPHLPTDQVSLLPQNMPCLALGFQSRETKVFVLCFVFAPQGGLQEARAVLEEVVANLAASEGEGV